MHSLRIYSLSLFTSLSLLVLFETASAIAEKPNRKTGSIRGTVSLATADNMPIDASRSFVVLNSKIVESEGDLIPKQHLIKMEGKIYSPSHLIVRPGDEVIFQNRDDFRHNVFSLSNPNDFDLGTYGPESAPGNKFEHLGVAKVYCNIHSKMATYVMVTNSQWSAITDETGQFTIDKIQPGSYELEVWNVAGSKTIPLNVFPNEALIKNIKLEISPGFSQARLRKDGSPYSVVDEEEDESY